MSTTDAITPTYAQCISDATYAADLDALVAAEVRADLGRSREVTVSGIARELGERRATLSARVNGHVPFEPSLLAAVAAKLGTTASQIVARAEDRASRGAA